MCACQGCCGTPCTAIVHGTRVCISQSRDQPAVARRVKSCPWRRRGTGAGVEGVTCNLAAVGSGVGAVGVARGLVGVWNMVSE